MPSWGVRRTYRESRRMRNVLWSAPILCPTQPDTAIPVHLGPVWGLCRGERGSGRPSLSHDPVLLYPEWQNMRRPLPPPSDLVGPIYAAPLHTLPRHPPSRSKETEDTQSCGRRFDRFRTRTTRKRKNMHLCTVADAMIDSNSGSKEPFPPPPPPVFFQAGWQNLTELGTPTPSIFMPCKCVPHPKSLSAP